MTDLYSQIRAALHAHRRQHETSMHCECGAWTSDMDAHRADAAARLVQPALDRLVSERAEHQKRADQSEELLAIAHETSNTAETERARLAAEVDRLGDWYRTASARVTTTEAERDRYHGELVVNEADRAAAVSQLKRAEAAVARVRKATANSFMAGPNAVDVVRVADILAALAEPKEA